MHITEEVVRCLGDDFEFEAGDGIDRNAYLRDNNIKTYFVKPNSTRAQVSLSLVTKKLNHAGFFFKQHLVKFCVVAKPRVAVRTYPSIYLQYSLWETSSVNGT